MLRDIILPSSFLRPTFSMDLSIGDTVFYTAPMACDLLPRWLGQLKTDSSTWNTTKMG